MIKKLTLEPPRICFASAPKISEMRNSGNTDANFVLSGTVYPLTH